MTNKKKTTNSERVQGVVSPYHKFAVTKLIGIKGTNESDIVGKIIDEWVTNNVDYLEKAGVTVEKWRKKRGK